MLMVDKLITYHLTEAKKALLKQYGEQEEKNFNSISGKITFGQVGKSRLVKNKFLSWFLVFALS
jgi:hypothetical protein